MYKRQHYWSWWCVYFHIGLWTCDSPGEWVNWVVRARVCIFKEMLYLIQICSCHEWVTNTKTWASFLLAGLNAGSTSAIQKSQKSSIAVRRALQTFSACFPVLCSLCLQLLSWAGGTGWRVTLLHPVQGLLDPLCWYCIWASLSVEKDGDRAAWRCVALLGLGCSGSACLGLGIQFFPKELIFM